MHAILLLGSLLVAVGWPGASAARETRRGRSIYEAIEPYMRVGVKMFKKKDYAKALESFLAAKTELDEQGVAPKPGLYRAIARCYDQLGSFPEAKDYYQKFLASLPETKRARRKWRKAIKEAEDAVERLGKALARTGLTFDVQPDGVEISLDGEKIGTSPMDGTYNVAPGEHEIRLDKAGLLPREIKVEVQPGAVVPVVVVLQPEPKPESPPVPVVVVTRPPATRSAGPPPAKLVWRPWAVGIGVVFAAASWGTAWWLLSGAQDLEADADELTARTYSSSTEAKLAKAKAQSYYDSAAFKRTFAGVMTVAGVAGLGLAAYAILTDEETPEADDAGAGSRASLYVIPTAGGLALGGTF